MVAARNMGNIPRVSKDIYPDNFNVISAIRKRHRSNYVKRTRSITLCLHFLTSFFYESI